MDIDSLIKIMQASISPAVLISGFGLLLLSMTNRLGRTIDRVRQLNAQRGQLSAEKQGNIAQQMAILFRRGRILQFAITFNVWGIFAVSVTVLMLFLISIWGLQVSSLIEISFLFSLVCLIVSLLFFLYDITLSLKSLSLEIRQP